METEKETDETSNINYCNICDVTCSSNNKLSRHLLTASHKKIQNGNKGKQQSSSNPQIDEKIFKCEKCEFNCLKKCDWDRHIQTQKHKGEKKEKTKFHCECGTYYLTRSGLWKHQKKCTFMSDEELIQELIKTNIILKELIKYMFTK